MSRQKQSIIRARAREELKKKREQQNKIKRTNKATKKLSQTIASAQANITGTGRKKVSQGKSKSRAQAALAEQFKTKGAGKSIQNELVKAGHSQSSLDLKRAKHSLSKANRAEMNRLRRGTEAERVEYKKRKKKQRQESNKARLKAGSHTWD